jgi:RNA polymerase sigma-70 factor, ECF subfamily
MLYGMMQTPVTLLDRLRRQPNEGGHWERFVRLFTPILSRWAYRLNVSPSDTDDLLQETFTLLIGKLAAFEYDPQRSFRAWLWTVFRHHVLAWRKRHSGPLVLDGVEVDSLAGPDANAELIEAEYRHQLLDRALKLIRVDFPDPTWQIFWQCTVDGKSGVDVAKQFSVSPNAVYLIRGRVLARLRQELTGFES